MSFFSPKPFSPTTMGSKEKAQIISTEGQELVVTEPLLFPWAAFVIKKTTLSLTAKGYRCLIICDRILIYKVIMGVSVVKVAALRTLIFLFPTCSVITCAFSEVAKHIRNNSCIQDTCALCYFVSPHETWLVDSAGPLLVFSITPDYYSLSSPYSVGFPDLWDVDFKFKLSSA